jgi:DNA-binding transcriptional MerR regulator
MAANEQGISGDALKRAKAYNAAMEKAAKSMEQQEKAVNTLSTTFLGIGGNEFFRNLTNDEYNAKLAELQATAKSLETDAHTAGMALDETFNDIAEHLGVSLENSNELADKLGLSSKEAELLAEGFARAGDEGATISDILQEMGEYSDDLVDKIVNEADLPANLVEPFKNALAETQDLNTQLDITKDQMGNVQESVFDIGTGLSAMGNKLTKSFRLDSLITSALKYDETIKKAQIDTGIAFADNSAGMSSLTSQTARFGMSIEETTQMMGALSSELRTTNFAVLEEAAKDLAAMGQATGLNVDEISKLSKEYIMFGSSAKKMAEDAAETMKDAAAYGLNGKEVMQEMAAHMKDMRKGGFTGGEASLRRMVLESKRLGMSVDDVFETGKRARSIEGAMEMAAELQLAGGSFAAIDPMQLLSAARKGPEELQKLLGQMGSDIGSFNEETGEYQFDPVDVDRLQMVSDATGQSMDSLQNMIAKNADDNQKLNMLPDSMMGADLSDEEKAFLMNATSMKGGKLSVNAGVDGLGNLENLTQEQIQEAMALEKSKKEDLEKQATENQSLKDSIENLKNSVLNTLIPFLEPIIAKLTEWVSYLNTAPEGLKIAFGIALTGLAILFGPAKAFINGIAMGKGFNLSMKGGGMLKGLKSVFSKGGDAVKPPTNPTAAADAGGGGGGGGWVKSLAEGIKSFKEVGMKDILKFGFALVTIGAAVTLFMMGIQASGGADGAILASAAAAMIILAGGLWLSTKILGKMSMKDVLMGALAMGVMGLALIPFAYAAQMMSEVDWFNVLAGIGVAILVVALLVLLGVGMMWVLPFLLLGAAGLAIAGIALLIAAVCLSLAGEHLTAAMEPLEQIKDADWSGLAPFAEALSAFGFGTIAAGIGLLIGAIMLAAAAPFLAIATPLLIALTDPDWKGLYVLAGGLNALSPALFGFALAGLAFFNPFVLFGLALMLEALFELKWIMVSLGPNLALGADGIERMAAGVGKLESAVKGMNVKKLEKLAEVMAEGGAEMGKFVAEVNRAESTKVTHVVKLQLDGKDLQEIILKDTKHTN